MLMFNHPIRVISPVQQTKVTQIFIPKGKITLNADYPTSRLTQNISALYEESRKLCQTSNVIEEFVSKNTKNLLIPDKRNLHVLRQNIKIPVKKFHQLGHK